MAATAASVRTRPTAVRVRAQRPCAPRADAVEARGPEGEGSDDPPDARRAPPPFAAPA